MQQQQQPQRQTAPPGSRARRIAHRTKDSCDAVFANTLCSLFLGAILVVGVVLFVVWLTLHPHRPRFSLVSFSISGSVPGGRVTFNVSDRNPNHHIGIYYDTMQASLHYYDALVASGAPFAASWYQPNMSTTSITGILDITGPETTDASWPSFSAALHANCLTLRLHLTTVIRFQVNIFHSGRQRMFVNCDMLVGADGHLLPDSMGVACDRYF